MQRHHHVAFADFVEYPADEMLARATAFAKDIARRHSCRDFSDRPVSRAIIKAAIAAAGKAPSRANHQPWLFAAVESQPLKARIREAAEAEERDFYDGGKAYLEKAPWLIGIFAQRRGGVRAGDDMKNYYIKESVGIATGILITALHHAGLATLMHTPNPMNFLNEICERPANEKPWLLLVVGYPAATATIPTHAMIKKPLAEIASFH